MATDQYHEPAEELSQKTRTFARMITGLIEEAEAIGWYEQRIVMYSKLLAAVAIGAVMSTAAIAQNSNANQPASAKGEWQASRCVARSTV